MANDSKFDLTVATDLFKERFVGVSELQYNNSTPLISRIKKSFNFVGKKDYRSINLSAGVGRGAGSLPTASHDSASYDQAEITAKKLYCVVEIDREAMKAGKNSEGIFNVSAMREIAERAVTGMNLMLQRILFGDGTGSLYVGNASNTNVSGAGTSGDPYVINLDGDATSVVFANLEEGDLVNVNAETTDLSVAAVSKTSGSESVSVVGTSTRLAALSGSGPFTTTDNLYLQNSKDNEPEGLDLVGNTTGTSYAVSHTKRRWQGTSIAAAGASVSEDLLNELILTIEEESGKTPDIITCSYFQFRKIKDFMSDHKRIDVVPRDSSLVGKVSFSALQFMSASGPIAITADRFVPKDMIYAINTDKIEMLHRPDWGWFDEDGTMFLRRDASDQYQARYGGYLQVYTQPIFHGRITGLADS